MLQFSDWFSREYKQWCQSQPGEEDFLAFCELLGYSPSIILCWLQGDSIPQNAELLSIAGVFGTKVYSILRQPEPDPELLKIYYSFTHLTGEYRCKLAQALWEAQTEMHNKGVTASSEEAKPILKVVFTKWGFEDSSRKIK
jgi:transcriptional regulator with XRE-family HTH domain